MRQRTSQQPLKCPTCREVFGPQDPKPNYVLREILAAIIDSGSGAASGSPLYIVRDSNGSLVPVQENLQASRGRWGPSAEESREILLRGDLLSPLRNDLEHVPGNTTMSLLFTCDGGRFRKNAPPGEKLFCAFLANELRNDRRYQICDAEQPRYYVARCRYTNHTPDGISFSDIISGIASVIQRAVRSWKGHDVSARPFGNIKLRRADTDDHQRVSSPRSSQHALQAPGDVIGGGAMASTDCAICLATFKDPVVLPSCGHSFCCDCITEMRQRTSQQPLKCPTCREVFGPQDPKPNYVLREILAAILDSGSGATSGSPVYIVMDTDGSLVPAQENLQGCQGRRAPSAEEIREISFRSDPLNALRNDLEHVPGNTTVRLLITCDGGRFRKKAPPGMNSFGDFLANELPKDGRYVICDPEQPRYYVAGCLYTNHSPDGISFSNIISDIGFVIQRAVRSQTGHDVRARPFGNIKLRRVDTADHQRVSSPRSSQHTLQAPGGDMERYTSGASVHPGMASEAPQSSAILVGTGRPRGSTASPSVEVPAMVASQGRMAATQPPPLAVATAMAQIDPELENIFRRYKISRAVQNKLRNDGVTRLQHFLEYFQDVTDWFGTLTSMDPSISDSEVRNVRWAVRLAGASGASEILRDPAAHHHGVPFAAASTDAAGRRQIGSVSRRIASPLGLATRGLSRQ